MAFVLLTIFKKSKCLQCDTRIHIFKSTIENSAKQALPDLHLLVQLNLILKKKRGGIATLLMYISQSSLNLSLQYKTFFVGVNSRSIVTQEDGFRG